MQFISTGQWGFFSAVPVDPIPSECSPSLDPFAATVRQSEFYKEARFGFFPGGSPSGFPSGFPTLLPSFCSHFVAVILDS